MSAFREQRHFTRVPFDALAELSDDAGHRFTAQLLDISLKGALLGAPHGWTPAPGTRCRVEVLLAAGEGQPRIHMDAHVAHVESEQIGLRCAHIDLNSAAHLRRLLELNLGSEALLARELAELVGLNTPPAPPRGG